MKRRDAIEAIRKAFHKLSARKAGAEIRVDFVHPRVVRRDKA
jgi:hypothetical protein